MAEALLSAGVPWKQVYPMMRPTELAKGKGEPRAHKGGDKSARRRAEDIPLPESGASSEAALSDAEPPAARPRLPALLPTPKRSREAVSSEGEGGAQTAEKRSKGTISSGDESIGPADTASEGEEPRAPSPLMEVSALELLEPSGSQKAEQLQWPSRVKEAGPPRVGGWPGVPLATGELSPARRYLEGDGQAVYKIIIMERPEDAGPIQVSALWEYESRERAARVQHEMTGAGLPANIQQRL